MLATTFAPEVPTLVLNPTDRAPAQARRFLAEQFREWGITEDYIGRLVVTEFVTNAWIHGSGPIIVRLYLGEYDRLPVVEVWDKGPGQPVLRPENPTVTSGRGLLAVSKLTLAWGTRPLLEGGKVVWARLAT